MLFGGIEAGGTKMVCAVGKEDGTIVDRVSFPTREPDETFDEIISYFQRFEIQALGVGCFGPIDLNYNSKTYGHILHTPKLRWAGYDVVGTLKKALQIPVGFDTDVNGAILGEVVYGAAKGLKDTIYITIGTGVGVGVYTNGALLHGLLHPEAGHMLIERKEGDSYKGCCPFHKNCVEGLASGPAIEGRWEKKGFELKEKDEVWELEAFYIAEAITNYILAYSPQKIILWGGVMHQEQLFPLVRQKVKELLNGYIDQDMITEKMDDYIVPPDLGENPGILGAIQLGILEFQKN